MNTRLKPALRTLNPRPIEPHVLKHMVSRQGVDLSLFIERAALYAHYTLCDLWPHARTLVFVVGEHIKADIANAMSTLAKRDGLTVHVVHLGELAALNLRPDLILDAIADTNEALNDQERAAINWVLEQSSPVLALDVPSGLNSATGTVDDVCVRADATVSFMCQAPGLFMAFGGDVGGQVRHSNLNFCPKDQLDAITVLDQAFVQSSRYLAVRARNSHKGAFGRLLLVGGDLSMGGAITLCTEAALRCGAGLVTCATRCEHITGLQVRTPEAMAHGINSGLLLEPLCQRADVIAIGVGLGRSAWSDMMLQQALLSDAPLVLDADALNLLAEQSNVSFAQRRVIMTPHPFEAARLLKTDVESIQRDRVSSALLLARTFNAAVILKGFGSVVASPDGDVSVCTCGNAGMSSGGMGDVLTGVVGALWAQNGHASAYEIARLACAVHALAGDDAAKQHGERGLVASDVIASLSKQVNV